METSWWLRAEFKPRGSFKHCCFAQDGSIFAVVNAAGVGYILQYRQVGIHANPDHRQLFEATGHLQAPSAF